MSGQNTPLGKLDQDVSYDIKFDWPTWSFACEFFYMHAITKLKKRPHIEIQIVFQNIFHFDDSLYIL